MSAVNVLISLRVNTTSSCKPNGHDRQVQKGMQGHHCGPVACGLTELMFWHWSTLLITFGFGWHAVTHSRTKASTLLAANTLQIRRELMDMLELPSDLNTSMNASVSTGWYTGVQGVNLSGAQEQF